MNGLFSTFALIGIFAEGAGTWSRMGRFWSLQDPAVRMAVAGTLLLGMTCGLLGSFVVLRRMSLLGDSLGHAVLPGICGGFLVTMTKDIRWIFLGAVVSALLAAGLIALIHGRTKLKQDAAMGLVLSGFYGLGVVMLTRLQSFPLGNQSGLNRFLFGQASAIAAEELVLMAILSAIVLIVVVAGFKELAATTFDEEFAAACGLPVRGIHNALMLLVAIAIVLSIHAVGIVLLSAMLIAPAATAHLLTDRLKVMVFLSVVFGAVSGVAGANISFLGSNLPTGPFIVVVLMLFFIAAFLFSPSHGVLSKIHRRRSRIRQTRADNIIRDLHALGTENGVMIAAPLTQIAEEVGESLSATRRLVKQLSRQRLIEARGDDVCLTAAGAVSAGTLARNQQLWELFLSEEGIIAGDEFDPDSDDIEQILGADVICQLEARR